MDSWYVIRTDGRILREVADSAKTQTPIIDDATGRPLENAVAAAAMPAAGCALLGDGTVSCWREAANGNTSGQLGNGTTDTNAQPLYRATKVLVDAGQPLTDVSAFALSQGLGSDACVVTNTGKLYCWGDLTWLVNGGKALPSPYAVPITTNGNDPLMPVVQASIASSAACALIQGAGSNEVRCWGNNSFAVLGQGDTQNRQYATKVSGLSSPSAIVVGEGNWNGGGDARSTACAIDGSQVLCWGRNASGATGVAMTTDPILSPTAVVIQDGSILPAPTIVHAGANSFCAYEDTRTVWCWGAGSKTSAGNVGATNVVALGAVFSPSQPAFLSSDGTYHMGTSDSRAPNCNAL